MTLRSHPLRTIAWISMLLALPLGIPPVRAEETGRPSVDIASLARTVAAELGAGNLDSVFARFDATMKAGLPNEKLTAFWTGLIAQAGALKQCAEPRLSPQGEVTVAVSTCVFERQSFDLKLAFHPSGSLAGMFLLPATASAAGSPPDADYVKSSSFREKGFSVASGRFSLPATISIPEGAGPFPGLVLVHGSGPGDRDETVGGNKPFRDLARGLASRGIVVLRYEKRTTVYGMDAMTAGFTVKEETVDDALSAVKLLRAEPYVDPKRVFVLGHSLGGMLVPRIGSADPALAGLVVLAGNTRPLPELLRDQAEALGNPAVRKAADEIEQLYMRKGGEPAGLVFGAPASYWRDLAGYRPAETAKELKMPLLILQGERDYQVTMKDFDGWKAALAGRPQVVLKSYPKLNHLFIEGEGKSNPAEYDRPGHVAAGVVEDIASFLKKTPAATPAP